MPKAKDTPIEEPIVEVVEGTKELDAPEILDFDQLDKKYSQELELAEKPDEDEEVQEEVEEEAEPDAPVEEEVEESAEEVVELTPEEVKNDISPNAPDEFEVDEDLPELPVVKVRDSDGKQHEFTTFDDVPDDFEPFSYKDQALMSAGLTRNELKRDQDVRDLESKKAKADEDRRIKEVQDRWDQEIADLVEEGAFKADDKETIGGVYAYMGKKAEEGKVFDSFEHAYIKYSKEEGLDKTKETKKQEGADKRAKGAMVAGGGKPAAPQVSPTGNRVFDAPTAGTTLDQVHSKYLRESQ